MELKTLLFETRGEHNTDATLAIACERAVELGIRQVVVASSHGQTARKAQAYPRTFHALEIREALAKPRVP